MLSDVQSGT
jgi:hypothetical protein